MCKTRPDNSNGLLLPRIRGRWILCCKIDISLSSGGKWSSGAPPWWLGGFGRRTCRCKGWRRVCMSSSGPKKLMKISWINPKLLRFINSTLSRRRRSPGSLTFLYVFINCAEYAEFKLWTEKKLNFYTLWLLGKLLMCNASRFKSYLSILLNSYFQATVKKTISRE